MSTLDIEVLIFPLGMIIVDIYILYIFIYFIYIEYIHIMCSIYNILALNKSMKLSTRPFPDPLVVGRRSLEIGTWVLSYT